MNPFYVFVLLKVKTPIKYKISELKSNTTTPELIPIELLLSIVAISPLMIFPLFKYVNGRR